MNAQHELIHISYIFGSIPTIEPSIFLILLRLILSLLKAFNILLNAASEKLKFDFTYRSFSPSSNSSDIILSKNLLLLLVNYYI